MPLCIRDTPGVNDTFMIREQITIRAIRESRLCVVVLAAHQALSSVDLALIRMIANVKSREVIIVVNRIDEIVVFHSLDEKHSANIARIQLKYLEKRLARLEMHLEVTDAALAEIATAGFDPVFGARPLKRAIQERIENPLAKAILEGEFSAKDVIRVDVEGGKFRFTSTSSS